MPESKSPAPMARRPWKDVGLDAALCVLSGVLWFLSVATFDLWPLAWIATVPLLWVLRDKTPRQAFLWAMLTGWVANYGGFYWITGTLVTFASLPWIVGFLVCLVVCLYQGLVFGLFGLFLTLVRRRTTLGLTFLAPVIMVAVELIVPMEFPFYLAISQAWVRPVIQIADLAGPLGVTFVLILVSAAIYELILAWRERTPLPWKRAAVAGAVLVATLVYGFVQIHRYEKKWDAAPKLKVGVIQANLGIFIKGRADFAYAQLHLHHHLSLELQKLGADLVVWPESAHPFPMSRDQEKWGRTFFSEVTRRGIEALKAGAQENPAKTISVPLLVGVQTNQWGKGVRIDGSAYPEKLHNSAVLIDSSGQVSDIYDKMKLVKFSEQIPFHDALSEIDFFKRQFRRRHMSNFSPGDTPRAFKLGPHKLGPMICFEDILPDVGRRLAAEEPNLFVNLTNDAWFGATSEPYQHMALAVFRAIEHRRGMVRAVNTGTSSYIDATGRILLQSPAVSPERRPPDVTDPTPEVAHAGLTRVKDGLYRSPAWPRPHVLLAPMAMMPHSTTVFAVVGWLFGWICLALTLYLWLIPGRGIRQRLFRFRGEKMVVPRQRGNRGKGRGTASPMHR